MCPPQGPTAPRSPPYGGAQGRHTPGISTTEFPTTSPLSSASGTSPHVIGATTPRTPVGWWGGGSPSPSPRGGAGGKGAVYGAWPCIRAGSGRRRACLVRAPLGPSNWAGMHAHWPRNQLPCSMAGWRCMHACGLAPCQEVSGPLLGVLLDTPNHHCGTRVKRLQERHACMRLGCTRRAALRTKPSLAQPVRWVWACMHAGWARARAGRMTL